MWAKVAKHLLPLVAGLRERPEMRDAVRLMTPLYAARNEAHNRAVVPKEF